MATRRILVIDDFTNDHLFIDADDDETTEEAVTRAFDEELEQCAVPELVFEITDQDDPLPGCLKFMDKVSHHGWNPPPPNADPDKLKAGHQLMGFAIEASAFAVQSVAAPP